jgi:Uma2 family endonuclease
MDEDSMSALLKQKPRYNVSAFVEYIRPFPNHERWELLDGEPVLMSPPGERHQRAVMNILRKVDRLALERGYITDPILVAEVLSPSTAANDRGRKLEFYQTITSLRTILLVYPNERRVEHWTWTGNGWADGIAQGEGIVPLDGVGGEMTLAEVYEGLDG